MRPYKHRIGEKRERERERENLTFFFIITPPSQSLNDVNYVLSSRKLGNASQMPD